MLWKLLYTVYLVDQWFNIILRPAVQIFTADVHINRWNIGRNVIIYGAQHGKFLMLKVVILTDILAILVING